MAGQHGRAIFDDIDHVFSIRLSCARIYRQSHQMRVQNTQSSKISCSKNAKFGIILRFFVKNRVFLLHCRWFLRIGANNAETGLIETIMTNIAVLVLEIINVLLVQRAVGEKAF